MTAQISIQATLNNSSNNFVISWELASGGGIISSIAPPKPYGNPFQVNIPGLIAGSTYIIKLWESPSTSPAGSIRNSTNLTPTSSVTTIRADDYLVTDVTPGLVNGTSTYVNTSYAGWAYDVERVGLETMFPQGAPNVTDPDYAQDSAGGFHLIRTGDIFAPNEKFVVRFQPQVAPAQAMTTGIITSGEIITGTTSLTASDLNKAIFIQGSSAWLQISLPPLSTVQDWQWLYFFSAGGSHISAIINSNGSDKIRRNIDVYTITLCQNEQLRLFRANGVWNVDVISSTVDMVGEIIYRSNNVALNGYGYNAVPADGSLLTRQSYWRLFQYLQNSGIAPVSETFWSAATVLDGITYYLNKGNWTMGTSSINFRVPDLRDQFLRASSSANPFGTGRSDAVVKHKHGTLTGAIPGSPYGRMPLAQGFNGRYYNQQNQQADLTDVAYNDPGAGATATYLQRLDTETRPKSMSIPVLIRI